MSDFSEFSLSRFLLLPYWLCPIQIVVKGHAHDFFSATWSFQTASFFRITWRSLLASNWQANFTFRLQGKFKLHNPIILGLFVVTVGYWIRSSNEGSFIHHNIFDFILWSVCFLRAKLQLLLKPMKWPLYKFLSTALALEYATLHWAYNPHGSWSDHFGFLHHRWKT